MTDLHSEVPVTSTPTTKSHSKKNRVATIIFLAIALGMMLYAGLVGVPLATPGGNHSAPSTSQQPVTKPAQQSASPAPVDLVAKYANSAPDSLADRLKVWNKLPGIEKGTPNDSSNAAMKNLFHNWSLAYDKQDPRYLWGLTEVLGSWYSDNKGLMTTNTPTQFFEYSPDLGPNGDVTRTSPGDTWQFQLANGSTIKPTWVLRFESDHWVIDGRYSNPPA